MLFLGVDPGVSGAFAVINSESKARAWNYPKGNLGFAYDVLAEFHAKEGIALAAIERVWGWTGEGIKSVTVFMRAYGEMLGILHSLRPRIEILNPTPQHWQKIVYDSFRSAADMKILSVAYAKRNFPQLTFHKSDHGKADALHLASYARSIYQERNNDTTRRTARNNKHNLRRH